MKVQPAIRKGLAIGLSLIFALLILLPIIGFIHKDQVKAKPRLAIITSLPLYWAEGDIRTALDPAALPSPAYQRMAAQYQIDMIDDLALLGPLKNGVLLLAQPRAFSPQELVKIDSWVRGGGHLLIFADPALQWESAYPLGDVRRPLFTSLLSPLFAHWGVELVLPMDSSQDLIVHEIDNLSIRMPTPGAWQRVNGKHDAQCAIEVTFLTADCTVGKGRALLVADADLLNEIYWRGTGVRGAMGDDDFDNLEWIMRLINRLRGIDTIRKTVGGSG